MMSNFQERVTNILAEALSRSDIADAIKNDAQTKKEVKKIVSDVLVDMFRVLWQHNSLFKTLAN
jgi:hypothetical protein